MRIFLFLLLAVQVCQGQLRFEERVHDFGLIQGDDKRYTDFVAVNDGKKPINILRVDNFRDREVQSLISKVYLLPGEKAYIRVQINPLNEGRFSKDLAVYTTYNNKTIKLTVKGNTKNLADLQRQSCPDFNDNRNSTQKASFKSVILVEDATTGKPIKKAKVELIQSNYGLETKEFTGSNGECAVQLNPGLVQSQISADGYQTHLAPLVVKRSDAFHRIKLVPLIFETQETNDAVAQNTKEQKEPEKEDRTVGIYYKTNSEVEEMTLADSDDINPYDAGEKTVRKLPKEKATKEAKNVETDANDETKEGDSVGKFETNPINPYDLEQKTVNTLVDEEEPTNETTSANTTPDVSIVNSEQVEEKTSKSKFDEAPINPYDSDQKSIEEGLIEANPYDEVEEKDIVELPSNDQKPNTSEVVEERMGTDRFDAIETDTKEEQEKLATQEELQDEPIEPEPVVETEGFEESKFRANNVVFLIDKSISMRNDEKLDITKKSVIYLIHRFRSIDNLGVVVYDTDAEVLIPSASGDVVKTQIKNIEKLEASGKTFGAKGLREAYEMDLANFKPSGVNQIFIVTDGGFSEDISKVERVAKRCAAKNIRLHIIGVKNQKWTEKSFEAMAKISDGSYLHLSDIENAEELLFNFIKENSSTE